MPFIHVHYIINVNVLLLVFLNKFQILIVFFQITTETKAAQVILASSDFGFLDWIKTGKLFSGDDFGFGSS